MDTDGTAAETVRRQDPDRYFADLFAPAAVRPQLFALHAFNAEIARIRELVSEPLPGEIRVQWWRDALSSGEAGGHPLAVALLAAMREHRLPTDAFDRFLEARIFDLYDDPMPDMEAFEAYAGNTSSALFQLAAIILAGGKDPASAEAAGHAGVAYALAGFLRGLPFDVRRGQLFLPKAELESEGGEIADLMAGRLTAGLGSGLARLRGYARHHLRKAEAEVARLSPPVRTAFLPLALVEPNLRALERASADPLRAAVEIPLWRRQWILWRAARRLGR